MPLFGEKDCGKADEQQIILVMASFLSEDQLLH